MSLMQTGLILLLGAVLGSFLNVCIYRLPRKESIALPGSRCPRCNRSIPFLFNIPILSYLCLGGKCKFCGVRISVSYPLVELFTGILLWLVWRDHGLSLPFLHYAFLVVILLTVSIIDINHKLILNVLTLPGMAIGLASSIALQLTSIPHALLGILLGGGFLWLIGIIGKGLFKKDSMGGGDVKLGAMIGAFIGPEVLIALFLAFFLAMPVVAIGLGSGRLRPGSTLPFGPFISLATVVIVCFGPVLYDLYFKLAGYL